MKKKQIYPKDSNGETIRVGSVLENTKGDRGIVVWIINEESLRHSIHSHIGELGIETGCGTTRCTTKYSEWTHVPRKEQTHSERLKSWALIPYDHDENLGISREEGVTIEGILSLLPYNILEEENNIIGMVDALDVLAKYIDGMKEIKGSISNGELRKMENCSYLLPDPGGDVVRTLIGEIKLLKDIPNNNKESGNKL